MIKDKRLFFKFNKVQKVMFKHVETEVKTRLGITPVQMGVLFYLMKNDGCQLKDISKELDQNNSAITTLVERMEKNGLLIKKVSVTDGRAFQVYATDKGKELGAKGLPVIAEFNERVSEQISETELNAVHNFLDKALETFSKK